MILSAILSVSLLFPACTKLGAWDIIASAGQDLADTGPKLTKKRISISLAALAQGTTLSNFPILVRLQPNVFPYADCRTDGLDIRFRTFDGTELAFERDSWNKGGTSDFWVRIPVLAAAPQDTRIWIYFGEDAATDGSNAAGVWTNGYIAVLHGSYHDDPVLIERFYHNSVGSNDPDTVGPLDPGFDLANASIIGGFGFRFDGSNKRGFQFPATAAFENMGPLTFETWIRDTGLSSGRMIFFKGLDSAAKLSLSIQNTAALQFFVKHATMDLTSLSANNVIATGSWTHIALVWDGASTASIYSDGAGLGTIDTGPVGPRVMDGSDQLVIGNDGKPAVSDAELIADLDEIRISNVQRSVDWIKAQYLSQLGNKLVFGSIEDVADGP